MTALDPPRENADGPSKLAPDTGRLAIRGSLWTLGGQSFAVTLRLGGNLVLTRLLFPEVFGLMALYQAFVWGVQLLSSVGIHQCIVQNKDGEQQAMLETAWTIQAIRGCLICLVILFLSKPAALFYDEPILAWILPVGGLSAAIQGFQSINRLVFLRRIALRRVIFFESATQLAGLIVTIVLAWQLRSVWSLVFGNLTGILLQSVFSHLVFTGHRARFRWDRGAASTILRFGRWIFLATAFGFIANTADRFIVGKYLDAATFGMYSIGLMWVYVPLTVIDRLRSNVLLPLYSKLQVIPAEERGRKIAKARLMLVLLFVPPFFCLAIGGSVVVGLLYDPRYADAGWIVQVLACGAMCAATLNQRPLYVAMGKPNLQVLVVVIRSVALIGGMLIGMSVAGYTGLVVAVAAANLAPYPVEILILRRNGIWLPQIDLVGPLCAGLAIWIAWG